MLTGRPTSASAFLISSTAVPSEAFGAKLNEIDTDGNWPMWLTASGAVGFWIVAIADSRTRPVLDVGEGREIWSSELPSCCASGVASRITRYWLDWVKIVETMRWPNA